MKTIYRVFVLLAVMGLISAGFYLAFHNVTIAGGHEEGEREFFEGGERPAPLQSWQEDEQGEREFGERGEREGSLGWFSFLAAVPELLKVSVVAALAYWLQKACQARGTRAQTKANPPAAG